MEDNKFPRVEIKRIEVILKYTTAHIQRLLDEDHIQRMYNTEKDSLDRDNRLCILQSISVGIVDKVFYVLDGQHRLRTFDRLINTGYSQIKDQELPIVFYKLTNNQEMVELYSKLNSHRPVHPLETSDDWSLYGKYICDTMMKRYPSYIEMLGKRTSVRIPRIAYETFQTAIYNRCLMMKDIDPIAFIEKLECINQTIETTKYTIIDHDTMDVINRCANHTKTKNENTLYLSIFGNKHGYIDLAIKMVKDGVVTLDEMKDVKLIDFMEDKRKKRLPKHVKDNVWNKTNNKNELLGLCYVCSNEITKDGFECGHIVSRKLGGSDNVDNMMAICKGCNLGMGIEHMEVYKDMYYGNKK